MSRKSKSKFDLNDRSSFAYRKELTKNGVMLVILGKEYEAWSYDTYIFDALHIAGYWPIEDITYDRIVWLRTWLRENEQHGHDIPVNVRSISGAKKLIDDLINREYRDPMWEAEKKSQLERNAKIFTL